MIITISQHVRFCPAAGSSRSSVEGVYKCQIGVSISSWWQCANVDKYLGTYLPTCLPTCLPTYLKTQVPGLLFIHFHYHTWTLTLHYLPITPSNLTLARLAS
jgi:hypothetical protein